MVAAVEVLCPAFAADAALPTEVKVDVAEGKVDVAGKRIDAAGARVDVAGARVDVAGARVDVAGAMVDVAGVKVDVAGVKVDVAGAMVDVAGVKVVVEVAAAGVKEAAAFGTVVVVVEEVCVELLPPGSELVAVVTATGAGVKLELVVELAAVVAGLEGRLVALVVGAVFAKPEEQQAAVA